MLKIGMSLFAGVMMFGAMACDDGVADKVQNRTQCAKICSQLEECQAEVDQQECARDCAELAQNDEVEKRVEDCSDCLSVGSECNENVAECRTRCTGIVTLTAAQ